ncbi:ribonuclease H1-like [Venturia canescens]|uniref:ribonuclease H1-like n=1 Tax=Venturia canescens TaxID=32260 RepID=UPI001C9CA702|nr:ribonuclease H1-like [Venturia canescens]
MLASLESIVSYFARTTMGFYYAVAKGRAPGIYQTWEECKQQVHKFPGPIYKKFPTSQEAQEFIESRTRLSNNGLSSSSENFTHAQRILPNDLIALGTNTKTNSRTKRTLDSEETSGNSVKAQKRIKTVANTGTSSNGRKPDNSKHFNMDSDGFVNVYTDGACSGNGYSGAKAGVGVYFGDNSPLNISAPVEGRATNNMAEIQAVTRAAEVARENGITKLRVHTDSEFLIKSATQWMPGWKSRGWKTASGAPVINRAELQEMESALKPLKVEWNHVRGHQGVYGNEMADRLAREGAERYRHH